MAILTRRRFLFLGAAGTALAAYGWGVEPHWLEVVRRPLPISGLPRELAGRTLVQLSDLHVGLRVDDDYVRHTFAAIAALAPDIVVYTGDFTDWHPDVVAHAAGVYAEAVRGRLATLGVLGNHDYGPGWRNPAIASALARVLDGHGITLLRNQAVDVQGLRVVGMDDLWAKQWDPARAFGPDAVPAATLVLSHNPDTLDCPGWGGFGGWVLSGHTHGGQCKPPFLPPPLVPVQNRRYTAGAIRVDASRTVYINRGVGHTRRIRVNVRPEVTIFTLAAA